MRWQHDAEEGGRKGAKGRQRGDVRRRRRASRLQDSSSGQKISRLFWQRRKRRSGWRTQREKQPSDKWTYRGGRLHGSAERSECRIALQTPAEQYCLCPDLYQLVRLRCPEPFQQTAAPLVVVPPTELRRASPTAAVSSQSGMPNVGPDRSAPSANPNGASGPDLGQAQNQPVPGAVPLTSLQDTTQCANPLTGYCSNRSFSWSSGSESDSPCRSRPERYVLSTAESTRPRCWQMGWSGTQLDCRFRIYSWKQQQTQLHSRPLRSSVGVKSTKDWQHSMRKIGSE